MRRGIFTQKDFLWAFIEKDRFMQKNIFFILLVFYFLATPLMTVFAENMLHERGGRVVPDELYVELQKKVDARNDALQRKYKRREELLAELIQQEDAGLLNFENQDIDIGIYYQQKVYEEEFLQALEEQKSLQEIEDQEDQADLKEFETQETETLNDNSEVLIPENIEFL